LCVTIPIDNCRLPQMESIIGLFANVVPYRVHIESSESFNHLVQQIHRLYIDVLEHGHLPYQEIVGGDMSPLKILHQFEYQSIAPTPVYEFTLEPETENAVLTAYDARNWSHGNCTTLNDVSLTMTHNNHERITHCIFECSADLYNEATVFKMSRRFKHLLSRLFSKYGTIQRFDRTFEPINYLSLLLPEETEEIQRSSFYRQSDLVDTGMSSKKLFTFYRYWSNNIMSTLRYEL
jgi:hypothetical protein